MRHRRALKWGGNTLVATTEAVLVWPSIRSGDTPRQGGQYILREWLRQQGFGLAQFFPDQDVE